MRTRHLALALALVAAPAAAQTTGVPFVNDYTIAGMGSGSTSCTALVPPPGGGFPLTVSATAPGLPVLYALSFSFVAPTCIPGAVPLPFSPCLVGVTGALAPHTLDIAVGPGFSLPPFVSLTGPGGFATVFAPPLPPAGLGIKIATQAFILDPACGFPFLATQAYVVGL